MNNIEEYDERIEKFLRGEMSAMEEAEFKDDVAADPELQERAKIISALVRGLKRKGEAEYEAVIKEIALLNAQQTVATTRSIDKASIECAAESNEHKGKTIKMFAILLSMAAVLLLMFNVLSSYNRQGRLNDIVTPYYTSYSPESELRGDEDSVTVAELTELFNAIGKTDDCGEIIEKLEPVYKSLDKNYTYRPYEDDIAWYLSIAYIKDDQLDKAEQVLSKLIKDNPNTEISDKAKKLVAEIKKFE